MVDMAGTIQPNSSQMNADDLLAGPITIRIRGVARAPSNEQPIAVSYEGDDGKPYMPCKSMRRVMVAVWGSDANAYIGRSMTLYRDPAVTWGGMQVGGIRISNMSDIAKPVTLALTATAKARKPYVVQPLVVAPPPTTAATPDREAAIQAGTTSLIQAIDDAPDSAALDALLADPETVKRIDWRRANRPDQAQDIDAAVVGARSRLASVLPGDGWPGPT
jgi:hypothetical protein